MNQEQQEKQAYLENKVAKYLDSKGQLPGTYLSKQVQETKENMNHMNNPFFLLNLDNNLSIYHANDELYHVFDTDSESFDQIYQNSFTYTWTFQDQTETLRTVRESLQVEGSYQGEVDVITATGKMKTLCLGLTRSVLEGTGELLFGTVTAVTDVGAEENG